MADYFTMFSFTFDVGSAENAVAALALLGRLREDPDDEPPYGFEAVVDTADPNAIWISDGGQGDPDLTGRWGFVWAFTCSKPRLDGFGGGAQLLDLGQRRSLAWLDCSHRLQSALDPGFDADTGVAQSALAGGESAMGIGVALPDGGDARTATPSGPVR